MLLDTTAARGTTWVVDLERSTVGFTIAHFGVATVKGRFGTFAGTLADDGGALRASGAVDAATVDTGNPIRDRGLRGAEFFDVGHHPEIRFASRQVERLGADALRIIGDLTIRQTACQVELHARMLDQTADRLELLVTGDLNRAVFGIDSMELRAAGVSKRVRVSARLLLAR